MAGSERGGGMIRYCPDLTTREEVKSICAWNGDFTRAVLNPCIKEKCVAEKQSVLYGTQRAVLQKRRMQILQNQRRT